MKPSRNIKTTLIKLALWITGAGMLGGWLLGGAGGALIGAASVPIGIVGMVFLAAYFS